VTETIRYSRIFTEDLGLGTGTAEVQLADHRVVTMTEVNLGTIARSASVMSYDSLAVQNVKHADFVTAVANLGSTVATIVISDLQSVGSDLTVPSNITLHFVDQGQITVSSGATLTVNGRVDAPNVQIFAGDGTVDLSNTVNPLEYAYWKGGSGLPYLTGYRGGASDVSTVWTLQNTTGSTGQRLSLEASGAGGAEFQMLPGSSATPASQVTNDLILKHVPGTDLEQFRLRTSSNTYVIDSTYSNLGTARPIYFQMGARIEPSAVAGVNAMILYADASVDIHASSYTANGKVWGGTYARFTDPGDSGTTKVILDTRSTTPASNTADACFHEYRRGGTAKWSIGLNVTATAADSLDFYSSGGRFVRFLDLNSGPVIELSGECSSAPSAPDSNRARLYLVDNGSGKTSLRVIFASGAAQTIATQP
jgi:hypothetical protein